MIVVQSLRSCLKPEATSSSQPHYLCQRLHCPALPVPTVPLVFLSFLSLCLVLPEEFHLLFVYITRMETVCKEQVFMELCVSRDRKVQDAADVRKIQTWKQERNRNDKENKPSVHYMRRSTGDESIGFCPCHWGWERSIEDTIQYDRIRYHKNKIRYSKIQYGSITNHKIQ